MRKDGALLKCESARMARMARAEIQGHFRARSLFEPVLLAYQAG